MSRFNDFTEHEQQVILLAFQLSDTGFYDPEFTPADRETHEALMAEIQHDRGNKNHPIPKAPGVYKSIDAPVYNTAAPMTKQPTGGFDSGGHPVLRYPDGHTERMTDRKPTRKTEEERPKNPGEYSGFLYIECAHCGHIHAFCSKRPLRSYYCEQCGNRTPLLDMKPLRISCECGRRYNYLTNIGANRFDVPCYGCGAPVAVEWSDKWQNYSPITNGIQRRKKKGGRK